MTARILPYVVSFLGALALTLVLTPIVRGINRRLGMVDRPGGRRINRTPVPRGGGVALFLGIAVSYSLFLLLSGHQPLGPVPTYVFLRLSALAALSMAIGLADDKWSLPPLAKLAGQVVVGLLVWLWAGLGFSDLWPSIPAPVDCVLTVFWVVGAMNAFNLIDGLDGLASGLALIAVVGMAGGLFFVRCTAQVTFYAAVAGGLLGFLRYNYNPASVFLGDSGSMLIGYIIAVLPLCSHVQNSLLVSVGVPLLAMGVPIFDTSLAILRRALRRMLLRNPVSRLAAGVTSADSDHIHHRILRAMGLNQRKAAWTLYAIAIFLVAVGLVAASLRSRAAGLWLAAFAAATVIVFRDMARVEFFDAGMLLSRAAHARDSASRRRRARFAVPFYLAADICVLVVSFVVLNYALQLPHTLAHVRVALPINVAASFAALVFMRTYVTVWSRAMPSNYARLFLACAGGSLAGSVAVYYIASDADGDMLFAFASGYALLTFVGTLSVRVVRMLARDFFYALDCGRLVARKDVSRVLVYGSGLRYRAFRRELVRRTAENNRIIVGIVDDDILLRGHYIGGLRVWGTLAQAPDIINRLNADTFVVACELSDERLNVVRRLLAPTGVAITRFTFGEEPIQPISETRKDSEK